MPDAAAHHSGSMLPLVARRLTLDIGGDRRVDGVDLTLSDNMLTVVMGPNGAGKSLLLRLLHGLISPTAGDVSWGGVALTDAIRKRQAMVFQRPVLLRRSVAANVDFALKLAAGADPARRDALLDRVGLLDRGRQPARALSGGEQQRLALARALATAPDVLFLDEPTASLDPASVQVIEDIVRETAAAGAKVIFVTHDIAQARRLAGDVVFLDRGRLAEHSPAPTFFNGPASAAARDYLAGRLVVRNGDAGKS